MARSGDVWRNAALGPRSPLALRLLAVVVSAGLLFALSIFGAVQGALDGGGARGRYWALYWPFWGLLALVTAALATALAGRLRWTLGLILAPLLLAAWLVLVGR